MITIFSGVTAKKGWARVEGAEGKIKGGGVTPMLTHCLHIGFRGSTAKGLGVTGFALFPALLGKSGGVTFYESLILCKSLWKLGRNYSPSRA